MSRIEQNRKNAQFSTGPRTKAGKEASAMNAVKHGAYSEALTVLLEKPKEFKSLRRGMFESLRPVGTLETAIVERMASLWWRMERAKLAANQSLWMKAKADLFAIHRFSMWREPLKEVLELDSDECRQESAWTSDGDQQERLLRHELTLERAFFRLSHELEHLQRRRQGDQLQPPVAAGLNVEG